MYRCIITPTTGKRAIGGLVTANEAIQQIQALDREGNSEVRERKLMDILLAIGTSENELEQFRAEGGVPWVWRVAEPLLDKMSTERLLILIPFTPTRPEEERNTFLNRLWNRWGEQKFVEFYEDMWGNAKNGRDDPVVSSLIQFHDERKAMRRIRQAR